MMATVDLDKNEQKSIKVKGIKSWISGIFTHDKNSSKKSENADMKINDVNSIDSNNKNNRENEDIKINDVNSIDSNNKNNTENEDIKINDVNSIDSNNKNNRENEDIKINDVNSIDRENEDIKINDINSIDSSNKNNKNNKIIQHDYLNPKYVPKIMDEPIIISEDVSITYSNKHRKCKKKMENQTMIVLKKDILNVESNFNICKSDAIYNLNIYDDNNSEINNNILCNNFDNINNIINEHTPEPVLIRQEGILSHDLNNVIAYDINHDVLIGYSSEKNDILNDLFS